MVRESMTKCWDAIIVGAGPAGASCAVWLKQLGLNPLLVETSCAPGGLLRTNSYLDVWTVTSPGQTGQDMARQVERQIDIAEVQLRCQTEVVRVEQVPEGFQVHLRKVGEVNGPGDANDMSDVSGTRNLERESGLPGHGADLQNLEVVELARHVVVASGVSARAPEVMLESSFEEVLVGPGEKVMQYDFTARSIAILGGGDNAYENYLFAKSHGASSVKIFARSVRAQRQFVEKVPRDDVVIGDVVFDPCARSVNGQSFDCVLIFYGWTPRVDFIKHLPIDRDRRGFLRVNAATTETSVKGIYAIGEVTQRMHPCVPTAMADGVVAAKAIENQMRVLQKALEK